MHQKTLHAVAHKGKGKVRFDIAIFQQLGGKHLCQSFIAELVQLIPDVAVLPFFLVALGGGFRDFLIRYQLNGHFNSSTVSHRSSPAMRPWVLRIISNGAYLSTPIASRYSCSPALVFGMQRSSRKCW